MFKEFLEEVVKKGFDPSLGLFKVIACRLKLKEKFQSTTKRRWDCGYLDFQKSPSSDLIWRAFSFSLASFLVLLANYTCYS